MKRSDSFVAECFILCLFILAAGTSRSQTLIWSDEFEGAALDTSKWVVVNQEDWWDCWYAPHNVEVSNGTLKLHSQEELYNGKHWTGAKLESKYYPQYQYLEARVRHSLQDAHIWSAWWTVGWTGSTWQWPPEFDIFEFMKVWQTSPFQTYHWTGNDWDIVPPTGVDETEWHTYGVYWTAAEAPVFYLDGVPTYQSSGDPQVAQIAALLLLSSSPNRDDHYSGCPLGHFEVDYVRVHDSPPDVETPTNLALGKLVEVSSVQDGYPGELAVDGDIGTRWASDWSDPQYMIVDFEENIDFTTVRLRWEAAYASHFQIQVSNDRTTWATVVDEQNGSGGIEEYTVEANARYLKILGLQRGTGYGYSLYEVEVYDLGVDCQGADIDQSGTVDIGDLGTLVSFWLELDCAQHNDCEGADIYDDNVIDLLDFDLLAAYWSCTRCMIP